MVVILQMIRTGDRESLSRLTWHERVTKKNCMLLDQGGFQINNGIQVHCQRLLYFKVESLGPSAAYSVLIFYPLMMNQALNTLTKYHIMSLLGSSHQPDLAKAAVVVIEAVEEVVETYKVLKWQVGTKFKHWHAPEDRRGINDNENDNDSDQARPCFCGQYFAHWACGHWIKLPVRCGKRLSRNTGKPVFCKRGGKTPTLELVMDNVFSVEECDDCAALMRVAEVAFDELDKEASSVKKEHLPS